MQIQSLFSELDKLQKAHGDSQFEAIYGAGCVDSPELFLVFMNPTSKNTSCFKDWKDLRAPWIGTKNVWKMFYSLGLLSDKAILDAILKLRPNEWSPSFANVLYSHVADRGIYITNIAKCTTEKAVPVSNKVYKKYLKTLEKEVRIIKPKNVILFGNQVSSVFLGKNVSVSSYLDPDSFEIVNIDESEYKAYPTYYPVGQGQRNMPLAKERIRAILDQSRR